MPEEFLPVAEEVGLGPVMGELILREAVSQAQAWQAAGLAGGWLAVNLSAPQLRRSGLARTVRAVLAETGFAPESLMVEVTEGVFLGRGVGLIAAELEELHAAGVTVALDDFGTGYASLAHLRRFPIDVLKIDRSFVLDLPDDPEGAAIVRAVIGLGHSLGMGIVAEGVETEEQLAWLRLQGCDYAQGLPVRRAAAGGGDDRVPRPSPSPPAGRTPRTRRPRPRAAGGRLGTTPDHPRLRIPGCDIIDFLKIA